MISSSRLSTSAPIEEGQAIVRRREAAAAYGRAAELAPTDAERNFLRSGGRASR